MSGGPTWYSWFTFPFFAPLSGGVNQDISTGLYQGVPEIEIAIIKEVGSFGLQLGIISEAVKELAEKVGAMPPERSLRTGRSWTRPPGIRPRWKSSTT